MTYRVEFLLSARNDLSSLPPPAQARLARRIGSLSTNPRPAGAAKLQGSNDIYRLRVGAYRVLYKIERDRLVVLVVRIGHRRDVYRRIPS